MTEPIRIDEEFKNLVPPFSGDEYRMLERSLLSGGCRDPLIVWQDILLDGYNRYRICMENGIDYPTEEIRFTSRADAKIWIIDTQLGKRNLCAAKRIDLALAKAKLYCAKAKENQRKGRDKVEEPVKIRKITAETAGVSENTVYKFLQVKGSGGSDLFEAVMAGKMKIGTAHRTLQLLTTKVEVLLPEKSPFSNPTGMAYPAKAVLRQIEILENIPRFIKEVVSPNRLATGSIGSMSCERPQSSAPFAQSTLPLRTARQESTVRSIPEQSSNTERKTLEETQILAALADAQGKKIDVLLENMMKGRAA